jgi:hypothetical protein
MQDIYGTVCLIRHHFVISLKNIQAQIDIVS